MRYFPNGWAGYLPAEPWCVTNIILIYFWWHLGYSLFIHYHIAWKPLGVKCCGKRCGKLSPLGFVLPCPFLRMLPQLDKTPISAVFCWFFFGLLNQIRKVSAGCTIGRVAMAGWLAGWGEAEYAGKSNSQMAENYTKPKWELEGGKANEKLTETQRAQLWLSCKKFFVKIAGREFLNAFEEGERDVAWRSYAKHRRLL